MLFVGPVGSPFMVSTFTVKHTYQTVDTDQYADTKLKGGQ